MSSPDCEKHCRRGYVVGMVVVAIGVFVLLHSFSNIDIVVSLVKSSLSTPFPLQCAGQRGKAISSSWTAGGSRGGWCWLPSAKKIVPAHLAEIDFHVR